LDFPGRLFAFFDRADDEALLGEKLRENRELYCELGAGSGMFSVELASRAEQNLFFAFELRYKRAVRAAEKARERGLANLFVLRRDASELDLLFAPKSLSGIYLNFPDPWAKRRWKKHRLLNNSFMDKLDLLLSDNGFFSFRTDHEEYFSSFVELLESDRRFCVGDYSENYAASSCAKFHPRSEFELLFRAKGVPIYYLKIGRRAGVE